MEKYRDTFEVLIAGDGQSAVSKLARHPVDLIVTDLKMPRLDGFGLLAHVRENLPEIPVIIMSGFSTPETQVLARKRGAAGYLDKPFKIKYLAKIILTLLKKQSDGGSLRDVTASMFLQLVEMEQKTCTLRLIDRENRKRGVLFFQQGRLLDARCGQLKAEEAAYELFSWERVEVCIQNSCALKTGPIAKDLQSILLEAMQRKDEAGEAAPAVDEFPEISGNATSVRPRIAMNELKRFKGVEEIYSDGGWQGLLAGFAELGKSLGAGELAFACARSESSSLVVLLPDEANTVVSLGAKCPRERLFQELLQRTW
jgi:CheY-like chemotaxis protein